MSETHFVVYIIERKQGRERTFKPGVSLGAFLTKRKALRKVQELNRNAPVFEVEYRVTGYWDKRPW